MCLFAGVIAESLNLELDARHTADVDSAPSPATIPVRSPWLGFPAGLATDQTATRSLFFWLVAIVTNAAAVCLLALAVSPRFRHTVAQGFAPREAVVSDNTAGAPRAGVPRDRPPIENIPTDRGRRTAEFTDQPVAWFAEAADCQWADPASALKAASGEPLAIGTRLHLRSGSVSIAFWNGARLVLEGPAACQITGREAVDLELGKLTARMKTAQARGLVVRTSELEVVDLGTEFGVEVDSSGQTDVQVLEIHQQWVPGSHLLGPRRLGRAGRLLERPFGECFGHTQPAHYAAGRRGWDNANPSSSGDPQHRFRLGSAGLGRHRCGRVDGGYGVPEWRHQAQRWGADDNPVQRPGTG
jgi:hypothetical protein